MNDDANHSPWMCHICDYCSNVGEGLVCSECYKITCPQHMTVASVLNPESGLFELKKICVECQLKKRL
ncbi:hypothetical protein [Malonomonas rubra]|uniref:hypothetical protein n=1 Tax=Malonomonas rubra TaxID=57040 RepID=UPI0026EF14D4|nr:hypothetical protein [Malonomonas rubra]